MSELNMRVVRDAVIDYVANGLTVPDNMSAESYAEAMYDMDTLCDQLYSACESAGVGPDKLDGDEFLQLLEQNDTGDVVEVDLMNTDKQRGFAHGVGACKSSKIDADSFYTDIDAFVRLRLYINKAIYGKPGVMFDIRLSRLADAFTEDAELNQAFKDAAAMGSEEPFHSVLCVGDDFFDLSDTLPGFDYIEEPKMMVAWYHNGIKEFVAIPIAVVMDARF